MDTLHAARVARAGLAFLFDPDSAYLRSNLAARGPVAAFEDLVVGGALDPAMLRPEHRRTALHDLRSDIVSVLSAATRDGGRVVIPEDPDWPPRLADLAADPPEAIPAALCLFVRGNAPLAATLDRSVTITGARAATSYGGHIAADLATGCADSGWTPVTGGGFGIDTAVLRGALLSGGATAVLPCGLDRLHPTGNTDLFARITENGLLISVWPPGTLTSRTRFLANFRLLAALTAGTVLVEASLASGTLTALREAVRLGRPAMVMPGPVTSAQSAGCHEALRRYPDVRLVTDAADVLAELDTPASATASA